MTALIVVLAVAWLAVLLVAGLPAWDRDRPPPARHVRVPFTELIGGPQ